ncbi:MFS transporter [Micrococcus luteus]|uniref:MFS transporter n=1 Tax=Micrococcus luteus TaxID=1270 RepID=UPI00066752F4|nr:MFS transporter [Micrococcus luteus]
MPWGSLLALAAAGFLAIFTETIPAGLLPSLSSGLGVTESGAGQLVTAYALGSVVAAIPLVAWTQRFDRKHVLAAAVAGLGLFNLVTAVVTSYWVILGARFLAGAAAALVWGVLAGYGRRLAPAHLQGRALAITGIGQPIALAGAVPLGAFAASRIGWQWTFGIISIAALLLLTWVWLALPSVPGRPDTNHAPVSRVLRLSGIRTVLVVTACWILAHNTFYTYIAPLLEGRGPRLEVGLAIFGIASLAGIMVTGRLIDPALRTTTLVALGAMALGLAIWLLPPASSVVILTAICVWGLSFGGAPALLQTALADRAGTAGDAAQSIFVTVFNLSVAGGGIIGGLLLASPLGTTALAAAATLLTLLALAVSAFMPHAFPPGPRTDREI